MIKIYAVLLGLTLNALSTSAASLSVDPETPTPYGRLLYQGLVASLEENRKQPQNALHHYLEIAQLSGDPTLAQYSTLFAINSNQLALAPQAASLWAALEPQHWEAQVMALLVMLEAGTGQGQPYYEQALQLNAPQMLEQLSSMQRFLSDHGQQQLREMAYTVAAQQPSNASAQLLAAYTAFTQADNRNASRFAEATLTHLPDSTAGIILKTRLIRAQHQTSAPALRYLHSQLEAYPSNPELRFFYATLLLEDQTPRSDRQALQELKTLLKDARYGGLAHVLLSEYYLEHEQFKDAIKEATQALKFETTQSSAQYLLGVIDEHHQKIAEALQWYNQITTGPYYLPALIRKLDLLQAQGAFEEALMTIEEAEPETIEDQKQLLLKKMDLLQKLERREEAIALGTHLLEHLPEDPQVLETLQRLNLPLQAKQ